MPDTVIICIRKVFQNLKVLILCQYLPDTVANILQVIIR